MEIVQILGLVTFGLSAIGATIIGWKWIDSKRIERSESLRTRAEHNEKIVHDKTWEMWQNERQLRSEAETKLGIVKDQLARERKKTARLEQLLAGVKVSDIAS